MTLLPRGKIIQEKLGILDFFVILHGVLWEFLCSGCLKKGAIFSFFEISSIALPTTLNKMA
jgi:hypothetical protein